ncbi:MULTISPECIES: 7-cyano-7-deazaguanine synthase [Rhodopseudomonas]|nr:MULTISPECIES: 7-cyano-7-deazaguanine synthase [Rhodopseudomonas]MDF3812490.1 7-cyano-7-deazaguanine synthase [Rhodopseudomonas sp. BAL398]WOK19488.1 7-cyano-7-deazaguanine synthase [Rhodopseudomonas sp. BAL398]
MSVDPKMSPTQVKCLFVIEKGQHPGRMPPKDAVIAEIGRHIHFNAAVLDTFDVKGFEALHYDMLVLCAAIEFADRRWKRPLGWRRTLDVAVPVIDLKTWQKPDVLKALHSVLNHLTGDAWQLTFVQAKNLSPIGSRQMPLDFGKAKTFAVAYSDGLDSRAVSALSGNEAEALCIRVAGNRQRRKNGDSYFTQIPFKVKGYRGNESSFRSRGFQFAAVTGIAAQLSGVTRIIVPESGQGALGPVLLPLHNIYADYRNHPTFFRKMERFIKAVLGSRVRFEQPRLWSTKGQTLRAFLSMVGKSEQHLTSTHSCWQTRRVVNVGGRKQCGLCAACLLRRLSLHAAGVNEASGTYVVSNLAASDASNALSVISQKADRDIMVEYGSVGARHLQHLADMAGLPDDALRVHASQISAAIEESYDETLKKLRTMLVTHAGEWRAFLSAQGDQSFLRSWMDGGRFGRSE